MPGGVTTRLEPEGPALSVARANVRVTKPSPNGKAALSDGLTGESGAK